MTMQLGHQGTGIYHRLDEGFAFLIFKFVKNSDVVISWLS